MKSYLWCTISQERLNGLALMAIESVLLEVIDIENVIDEFVSRHVKRASLLKWFIWNLMFWLILM